MMLTTSRIGPIFFGCSSFGLLGGGLCGSLQKSLILTPNIRQFWHFVSSFFLAIFLLFCASSISF
jgi:hypothetical protein